QDELFEFVRTLKSKNDTEGYVFHMIYPSGFSDMIKIKTDSYVGAHKLITERNPSSVLEAWSTDKLDDLVTRLDTARFVHFKVEALNFIQTIQ
ncbi:hypothetical protein M3M33_13635, partial [Loigolactobacillus coryniformis]|uniref:hypothetical protein n=1 Tax=Loigolactobacillus coryniformis TaxID=1610 RepID=UPI00201A4C6A